LADGLIVSDRERSILIRSVGNVRWHEAMACHAPQRIEDAAVVDFRIARDLTDEGVELTLALVRRSGAEGRRATARVG
jgi:hypothetical protein